MDSKYERFLKELRTVLERVSARCVAQYNGYETSIDDELAKTVAAIVYPNILMRIKDDGDKKV